MAKVFTITQGLENMGALRTGGQGSVYKARKTGTIITAVKILPTPIHVDDSSDKHFRDFQNEVEKLKKVNEKPNPYVVKILNSGLTESGSFPFIEMEYIEGPDLEELLKPPHDPVFAVREVIKLAEQLANALAHCHKVNIKHGDIKSNNVKFNLATGTYVLLDFGLAIMSDEQRRTSLRQAGAIEFMAPEQHNGEMFLQTDIYSYGIILYELLAGTVPFPLINRSENARNNVMVAHMEKSVPDIFEQRKLHLPEEWPVAKMKREMQIPKWLLDVIDRCLEKDPNARYANGIDLYEAICLSMHGKEMTVVSTSESSLQKENKTLRAQNAQLAQQLAEQQQLEPATRPSTSPQMKNGIFWAGLFAGTLDALAAVVLNFKTGASMIFKFIASGAFGKSALTGGTKMILAGVFFHYFIAYAFATIFYLAYPYFISILRNKYVAAIAFGVITWLIMNLLVVPASHIGNLPMTLKGAVVSITTLIICIGLPIAWIADNNRR